MYACMLPSPVFPHAPVPVVLRDALDVMPQMSKTNVCETPYNALTVVMVRKRKYM